ncbi:MAG TPA: alpha/beta hydrolase [Trueperaceae bacterium]|nr:alpha/beta hydrolase [Trueperaceae bacterium]
MPGYLYFTIFTGLVVITMLTGPRRPRALGTFTYMLSAAYNEVPFLFLFLLAISVVPEYLNGEALVTWDWIGVALAALLALGLLAIAWRGYKANGVIAPALDAGLGDGWRKRVAPERLVNLDEGPRWAKVLFMPFVLWRRGVERLGNVQYGPDERNVLDIYRSSDRPQGSPVLIYFHSGGFYSGNKRVGSGELLHRLAKQGWLTISANYRLRPQASTYFEHLADAKRVIAWVHEHAAEYGADPSTVIVTGGSAGAQLAMVAAQSQNEPNLQPGFEEADTSVTGAVGLYGWYGGYYGMGGADSPVGPLGYDASKAPPVFIAHGELDTVATIESARRIEKHLRARSSNPVVFAELPGGHHGFDLFYSLRYEAVVDGVEAFAAWVRARDTRGPSRKEADVQLRAALTA